ncbi:MAG: RidA family protein [Geminicoccaceae bacterium]
MRLEHLSPPEVRPPFGRYHQAVAATGAERLLFVSGQLGVRPDGSVPQEIEAQAEQAFANIEACLAAGGFAREQIVRLTVFLTETEYRHGYMRVRDAWVADPPPASTLIIVKALALSACKVEIEAIAAA